MDRIHYKARKTEAESTATALGGHAPGATGRNCPDYHLQKVEQCHTGSS